MSPICIAHLSNKRGDLRRAFHALVRLAIIPSDFHAAGYVHRPRPDDADRCSYVLWRQATGQDQWPGETAGDFVPIESGAGPAGQPARLKCIEQPPSGAGISTPIV